VVLITEGDTCVESGMNSLMEVSGMNMGQWISEYGNIRNADRQA
jgi:hypothetical protein